MPPRVEEHKEQRSSGFSKSILINNNIRVNFFHSLHFFDDFFVEQKDNFLSEDTLCGLEMHLSIGWQNLFQKQKKCEGAQYSREQTVSSQFLKDIKMLEGLESMFSV